MSPSSKYEPLTEYLRSQPESSTKLTFTKIDLLVGGLPNSARNHDAWWANSRTADSHTWAHLWISAGWECRFVDRFTETVVFQRIPIGSTDVDSHYWWVNHKQTFKAELEGGYIWSPKVKKNGIRNLTYDNLTRTKPSDIVLSFAGAQIKAVGVVTAAFRESLKPEEFGKAGLSWSGNGWLVPIEWTTLPVPLTPKACIDRIQPLLPEKNSPLQSNGNGNQGCYLAAISSELGKLLLLLAEERNGGFMQAIKDTKQRVEADIEEQSIQSADHIFETDKQQIINSRRGQGLFRQRVLAIESMCRLTKVDDQSFLIASHIKPWKVCTNAERLDGHNGLMLSPHVDKLFDRGWVSFTDGGRLLVANNALPILDAWKIDERERSGTFSAAQKIYLQYHREAVFKGG